MNLVTLKSKFLILVLNFLFSSMSLASTCSFWSLPFSFPFVLITFVLSEGPATVLCKLQNITSLEFRQFSLFLSPSFLCNSLSLRSSSFFSIFFSLSSTSLPCSSMTTTDLFSCDNCPRILESLWSGAFFFWTFSSFFLVYFSFYLSFNFCCVLLSFWLFFGFAVPFVYCYSATPLAKSYDLTEPQ